ncbi:Asp-tRNA(Asn)/Glu-tRNA(Gln) amidotransferase subunit GatC [Candidatus Kapabacteria bacterium]|nr:Asp-tRNA(Asn)/Glu-tRNA(Gln) amidotransferase subunit GatC [Candidatus Kapabacteria bacterium]
MKDEIIKIANLASISLSNEEAEELAPQFKNILKYVSKIEELDLDNCEPLFTLVDHYNEFRPDKVTDSLSVVDAIKNAPKKNDQFVKVPKVLD